MLTLFRTYVGSTLNMSISNCFTSVEELNVTEKAVGQVIVPSLAAVGSSVTLP